MIKSYENCFSGYETRLAHPPSPEYLDNLIEGLRQSQVDCLWHSVVDPRGIPLFPSKVFPVHHSKANADIFHEMVDRVHEMGGTILNWYPLHLCKSLLQNHPEWRLQYYDFHSGDPAQGDPPQDVICPNSPFGELLPRFLAEVIQEFDFDGHWLDGTLYGLHWGTFSPGCRCTFCETRFRNDTGFDLPAPESINRHAPLADPVAKRWVRWRYDVLMGLWENCVKAVVSVKPSATVGINNLRHRGNGWNLGIPLRPLGFDCTMCTETLTFPGQADLQIKLLKAYECRRGVDTWQAFSDHGYFWSPEVELLTFKQGMLATLSAGGDKTPLGGGCDLRLLAPQLRELHELSQSLAPFKGGETVEYIGILASQQTEDFYLALSQNGEAYHGANELCRHAHFQSSILFDEHLTRGDLGRYPILFVGNAACLSDLQAQHLSDYVKNGGLLFACHEVGTRDEWGETRSEPVLDSLLGIRRRGKIVRECIAELPTSEIGIRPTVNFVNGATLAEPQDDCEILARAVPAGSYSVEPDSDAWGLGLAGFTGTHLEKSSPSANEMPLSDLRPAALWVRPVGRGFAVYLAPEIGQAYLNGPTTRVMRLFQSTLQRLRPPRIRLEAPQCVTINTRIQADGRWFVHLHNAPGGLYRYPQPSRSDHLHATGEVVPVHDLILRIPGIIPERAGSGVSGQPYEVLPDSSVRIPKLELHEVLEITPSKNQ